MCSPPTEGAGELVHMIDAVTTNKTDFFREPVHFQFLTETALPEFLAEAEAGRKKVPGLERGLLLRAGAVYAGHRAERIRRRSIRDFQFSILATDISTRVLDKARLGIYDQHVVEDIPLSLKQKYFLRSKDRDKDWCGSFRSCAPASPSSG